MKSRKCTVIEGRALLAMSLLAHCHLAAGATQPLLPNPAPVVLTMNAADNQAFVAAVRAILAAPPPALAARLCLPLVSSPVLPMKVPLSVVPRRPMACAPLKPAEHAVVHVAVLRDGKFWRLFSTHPGRLDAATSLGSVAKSIGAVPLLALYGAKPDELWCVQAVANLKNADGFRGHALCDDPAAWVTAESALARSNNLAILWRLKQLPASALRESLEQAGVGNVSRQYHPAVALALGLVEYTPRQALECFDAMASGLAQRATIVQGAKAAASPTAHWCRAALATPRGQAFVSQLLAAPAGVNGTAAFLPAVFAGATELRAKTGTPSDSAGNDTGKVLVMSFKRGGHRYTALVAWLSPTPSTPLATRLEAADLVPLLRIVNSHIPSGASRAAAVSLSTPGGKTPSLHPHKAPCAPHLCNSSSPPSPPSLLRA